MTSVNWLTVEKVTLRRQPKLPSALANRVATLLAHTSSGPQTFLHLPCNRVMVSPLLLPPTICPQFSRLTYMEVLFVGWASFSSGQLRTVSVPSSLTSQFRSRTLSPLFLEACSRLIKKYFYICSSFKSLRHCAIKTFNSIASATMSKKPIFVATHPRACSTAFERVLLSFNSHQSTWLTIDQVFLTCNDTLKCLHEPFGFPYYYGPERLHDRFEDEEQTRVESGFSNETFHDVFNAIERDTAEVGIPPSFFHSRWGLFHLS